MRILFIHKHPFLEETLRNSLARLAERDSIHFFDSYADAEIFIENRIIPEQLHLDLIICENNVEGHSAVDFYDHITQDRARTFSDGTCYFHTIPVVLIVDDWENPESFRPHGFADVFYDIALENLNIFSYELASVMKEWRRKLMDDLSDIGIPFEQGQLQYLYKAMEKKSAGISTRILTDAYKAAPTPLSYDWIFTGDREMEIAIGKLEKEMKRAMRNDKREEHRISKILHDYPALIERDNYQNHWRETSLQRSDLPSRSYRFDFMLKPNFDQLSDLSVLELKLPSDRLMVSPNFHSTFSSRLIRSISQSNDYRRFVKNVENNPELLKAFGFIPERVDFTILVGRKEEKEKYEEAFRIRNEEFNASGANITTYDEYVQANIDYLTRRDLLSIF